MSLPSSLFTKLLLGCAFVASNFLFSAEAHTRLECPPPRSGVTGAKVGPCDAPDVSDLPAYPLQPNSLNTITWLEAISHPGAPARFALSYDGKDEGFEQCILLDHVPHDELSSPTFRNEETYHRSSITLWIPDVYCERCFLQLVTFMTDEVHGMPKDSHCAYSGALAAGTVSGDLAACPAVYHSCAPVSINGTIPRDIAQCNTSAFEDLLEWPFSISEQQHSVYYYMGNPGIYNQMDSRLLAGGKPIKDCDSFSFCDPEMYFQAAVEIPASAKYTSLEGSCAAIVDTVVEPFVLGQLPSTPKNNSN